MSVKNFNGLSASGEATAAGGGGRVVVGGRGRQTTTKVSSFFSLTPSPSFPFLSSHPFPQKKQKSETLPKRAIKIWEKPSLKISVEVDGSTTVGELLASVAQKLVFDERIMSFHVISSGGQSL